MIAGVQVKVRSLWRQTTSRLARAARLPAVVVEQTEVVLGHPPAPEPGEAPNDVPPSRTSRKMDRRSTANGPSPRLTLNDLGSPTDMNASVDTLAEQMLTLVEIVSAQEQDIKALKEQCRRLEEHDQAIAVAFTTFFHVLAAGRVAKLGEISNILRHIITVAEQEGRPPHSIKFLRDLATMLPEEQRSEG